MTFLESSSRVPGPFLILGISAAAYGVYLLFFYKRDKGRPQVNRSVALVRKNSTSLDGASAVEVARRIFTEEEVTLVKVERINHDCKLLRFAFADSGTDHRGHPRLVLGQHVSLQAEINREVVVRPYTPVTLPGQRGYFEVMVKRYELGKMSAFLHLLEVGKKVRVRYPVGSFVYEANTLAETLGLVGAGSGITPLLQLIRGVLANPEDRTSLFLLYQNRFEADILVREELVRLAAEHPTRLRVVFSLSNPPTEWQAQDPQRHIAGHLRQDHLATHLPKPGPHCKILLCGPGGFNKGITAMLTGLGFERSMLVKF